MNIRPSNTNNSSTIPIERSEVLYGTENAKNLLLQIVSQAKRRIDVCDDYTIPSVNIPAELFKRLLSQAKSEQIRFRYLTEITKGNIEYCKQIMEIAEVRHLYGIKANFAVSDTEYTSTAIMQQVHAIPEVIYSKVKRIVEQQQYLFETLWSKAISAEKKIREIEEGVELEKTHIIQDPQSIQKLFIDMIKLAQHEVLLIIPTINAFLREEHLGIIELLIQAAKKCGVNVRILTPINKVIENILENRATPQDQDREKKKDFDLRSINMSSEETAVSTVTIIVVDKKESLIFEQTDDTKENFIEAIGLATYSNSKPTVLSYISIFESLWKQVALYEQLKAHDIMQREFINIASHEMKTPTQAIVGYSDLIQKHPEKREEMIQAISRNAVRLQRLTNDILDVTRIDSQTLNLHKERFNIGNLIARVVEDYRSQIEKENQNIKLSCSFKQDTLLIEADRDRITQVISNLLSNAIKFTSKKGEVEEEVISVSVERKHSNQEEVIISIKDTGEGINPEILPRLFTKFATRSFSGTGLGLYISRNIVQAHGGGMWAENNPDGKGANFTFTLPLSNRKEDNQLSSERMTGNQK